jgi:uncharacterized protein YbjQ (UPF0145 family)
MDSTIDTGDPWDLGEQEQAPASGGINPLAEATGLFSKKQSPAALAADELAETADAELPEPALPDPISPFDGAAEGDIESALQELEATDQSAPVDDVDQVLQELEAAAKADDDSFELIPPPAPDEITPIFETYSPEPTPEPEVPLASDDDAVEPEGLIPPGPPDAGDQQYDFAAPASEPMAAEPQINEPVVLEPVVDEPTADEPVMEAAAVEDEHVFEIPELTEPVEIEFGKPHVPEGSELPTGKATQTVSEETMGRPALLTTDAVAGAKIAPVDMVIAVASVASPSEVADTMASVLDELRDRCEDAGGDVVIGVKTEISSTGGAIMVTAAGTAVSLL